MYGSESVPKRDLIDGLELQRLFERRRVVALLEVLRHAPVHGLKIGLRDSLHRGASSIATAMMMAAKLAAALRQHGFILRFPSLDGVSADHAIDAGYRNAQNIHCA